MNCDCEKFQVCPLCTKPKFPKIGPKQKNRPKTKSVYIHKIEIPEDKKCIRCGETSGTECYRHLETFRKHSAGKGVGIKCNDKYTFWGCQKCDQIMSTKPDKKNELAVMTHAEEWNWLIIKTHLL